MRYWLFVFVLFISASSCKKDEEPEPEVVEITPAPTAPSYEFKSQNLQGKIEGKEWRFIAGAAKNHSFGDSTKFSINLYTETDSNICRIFPDEDRVLFSIPKKEEIFELNLSFSATEDSHTITLFDVEATNNLIASEGAVQVVKIDSTSGSPTVELKIDARYNEDNFINGTCKVSICN